MATSKKKTKKVTTSLSDRLSNMKQAFEGKMYLVYNKLFEGEIRKVMVEFDADTELCTNATFLAKFMTFNGQKKAKAENRTFKSTGKTDLPRPFTIDEAIDYLENSWSVEEGYTSFEGDHAREGFRQMKALNKENFDRMPQE